MRQACHPTQKLMVEKQLPGLVSTRELIIAEELSALQPSGRTNEHDHTNKEHKDPPSEEEGIFDCGSVSNS